MTRCDNNGASHSIQLRPSATSAVSPPHASEHVLGGLSRRRLLHAAGLAAVPLLFPHASHAADKKRRPKVAVVLTSFTYRSHAHVILENFVQPYLFNGKRTDPGVDVVSIYADQFPGGDMTRPIARQFKIPVYKTIAEALTLGGDKLAVDAVLSIGEHGSYPKNKLGQVMYPRKRFFDEIAAVMKDSRRYVPLFNDKHLSYRWDWAKEMVEVCRSLGIPFMAGSSVPLAQRRPLLEMPREAEISEAISIHGGGVESYDFHALEVLESMIEGRKGGERGVAEVQFLERDALLKAGREGRWSIDLAGTAMSAELGKRITLAEAEKQVGPLGHGILIRYRDGLKVAVLKVGGSGIRWNFACRVRGKEKPLATHFYVGPWNNRNLFKALSHAIQHHFIHGKPPYPVERTLLVSGILDASMHSRHQKSKPLATPQLNFSYTPQDFRAMREMGASWKIITDKTPQPRGIVPHGLPLKKPE